MKVCFRVKSKNGGNNMSNKSSLLKKVIVLLIIILFLNSFSTFLTLIKGESTNVNILLQIGNPVMTVNNDQLQIDPINTETVPVIIDSRTLLSYKGGYRSNRRTNKLE